MTEVCCTSIVYATERKHTKVEFPEARIYEDTLNILLFEGRGEHAFNHEFNHELLRVTNNVSRNRDGERGESNTGGSGGNAGEENLGGRRNRSHQVAYE